MTKKKSMSSISKFSLYYLILVFGVLIVRGCFSTNVNAGNIGVRQNNFSGIYQEDLTPGLHWEVTGMHEVYELPSRYLFINYTGGGALSIRTKDNNTVTVDVSVPFRIKPGEGWMIAEAGNHIPDGQGGYRFERFARQSADDVLRAHLAELSSDDFYDTEQRLKIANESLEALNEKLAVYHLEAEVVLLRAAYYRPEFEQQLARIQLNEQTKLLDGAKQKVADKRQTLDNYQQGTVALAAAKEQDYAKMLADLERAYLVGLIDTAGDQSPGAARGIMTGLEEEAKTDFKKLAAEALAKPEAEVTDEHLLGIKNIQAETIEYDQRVRAESDGISQRLKAEANAAVAEVQGGYEARINALLDSPAGRAYVAYEAAAKIEFAESLTFNSSDGIPSVLRLRDFAKQFMGG
jgi:regulator of protease activity HflC (stomatin/prohibitin superfamily)